MSSVDIGLLAFIVVAAVVGLGWLAYEMRSDDEK